MRSKKRYRKKKKLDHIIQIILKIKNLKEIIIIHNNILIKENSHVDMKSKLKRIKILTYLKEL